MIRRPYAVLVSLLLPVLPAGDLSAGDTRPQGAPAFYKTGRQDWRPAAVESDGRRVSIRIDPSGAEAGRVLLLIRPPAGLDINDSTPPRLTGIKIDGKPKPLAADIWLGRGNWQPRLVAIGAHDLENGIATSAARFEVDGRKYGADHPRVRSRGTTFSLSVPDLDYGRHAVSFFASDTSPQGNETCQVIRWERYSPINYALASAGATLRADSHFDGYPDLAPLQDGRTELPGDHCRNDISWASAETGEPHWVEVDLGRTRSVSEVTLCWALWQPDYHTARLWEVQVPQGDTWRAVWSASEAGMAPRKFSTALFEPIVTRRLRVFQPAGGGPAHRPDIMWLAEVMVR